MITFDPDALRTRLAELETQLGEPGFWDDQARAAKLSAEHARLSRRLERYERLEREASDLDELEQRRQVVDLRLERAVRVQLARRAGVLARDRGGALRVVPEAGCGELVVQRREAAFQRVRVKGNHGPTRGGP